MADYNEKLAQVQQRLEKMVEYQGYFDWETNLIRNEIKFLRAETQKQNLSQSTPIQNKPPIREDFSREVKNQSQNQPPKEEPSQSKDQTPLIFSSTFTGSYSTAYTQKDKNNLEKFICFV